MHLGENSSIRMLPRYSAKKMTKPVNFYCEAQTAQAVVIVGDFNHWDPAANPMSRQPDGVWIAQIPLSHGHHRYHFLVDGQPKLDPRANGVANHIRHHRVSVVAVS